MTGADAVDAYLAAQPDDRRRRLELIRAAIRGAALDAVEVIAYGMPAFRMPDGRFLVSYAPFKRHDSLFPASAAVISTVGAEIEPYVAGKGTLRFPFDEPVPASLVARVVAARLTELGAGRAR